jgi:protein-disulfide isomerase
MMASLKVPVTPDDHFQGPENAPVTLVEYGDYQCPYCGRAYPIVKALQEDFGEQLRFVFKHFPLAQIHPLAEPAAETAEYAGGKGQFWEMHDGLYQNQPRLEVPLFFELAQDLGLSGDGLRDALESHEFLPRIRKDFMGGVKSGVNGTPSFFINGVRHEGSWGYEDLAQAIGSQLESRRVA